jgi:hypothetical protein
MLALDRGDLLRIEKTAELLDAIVRGCVDYGDEPAARIGICI